MRSSYQIKVSLCSHPDSNWNFLLRRKMFYPLNYEGWCLRWAPKYIPEFIFQLRKDSDHFIEVFIRYFREISINYLIKIFFPPIRNWEYVLAISVVFVQIIGLYEVKMSHKLLFSVASVAIASAYSANSPNIRSHIIRCATTTPSPIEGIKKK